MKTATNDDTKIEMQGRLEEAERMIHEWKEAVNTCEHEVNQEESELKKEGEFTGSSH